MKATPAEPGNQRPRVLVNFAASIDGKINPAPNLRHGAFAMSRDSEDLRRMVALRARADAVLIGAANLRADDPDLAIPQDERLARRARGEREPLRLVVTGVGAGLSRNMKFFDATLGGPSVVVHASRMPHATRTALAAVSELVELGEDTVDIRALLAWLVDRGVHVLLCEGGGALCAQLMAAGAVDELFLTVVPRVLGGGDAPTMVDGAGFSPNQIPDPTLTSVERIGDELFLLYTFDWSR